MSPSRPASAPCRSGVHARADGAAPAEIEASGSPSGRWAPGSTPSGPPPRPTSPPTSSASCSNTLIFCGHFPDQTYSFSQEETQDESRGAFYVRQLVGAANIEGSPLFHVASGNLGYQVEHHLFPDMPSTRYAEIAPKVKDICERYGLPYNSGPFRRQWTMVQRTIL